MAERVRGCHHPRRTEISTLRTDPDDDAASRGKTARFNSWNPDCRTGPSSKRAEIV